MKFARMVGIPMLAVMVVAAAGTLCAQNTGGAQVVGSISGGAGASGVGFGPRGIEGAPYSATRTTTRVQTLADGTTVTHTTMVKEARDSEGRIYRATEPETSRATEPETSRATEPEAGSAGRPHFVFYDVFDPVSGITMNWTSNGQNVTVNHFPQPKPAHQVPVPQSNQAAGPVRIPVPRNTNPDLHIDDLGTQDINGVLTNGRRITRVIPAGRDGNDQPITVSVESWTSSELHIVVLQITDDPRSGNSRMELSDIDRNEPDPSLFQAPEGYTVQEMEPVRPRANEANPQ